MTEAVDLGTLPNWDLSDLYPGIASAELQAAFDETDAKVKAFAAEFEGKIATISGADLGKAIAAYEEIEELIGRIMSYAYLEYCTQMDNAEVGQFFQNAQERINDISTGLLFFTLEINKLDDETLAAKMADPAAAHYAPWMRDLRVFKPYQLSDELEKMLHEKSVAGRSSWTRLFDETMTGLRFEIDGEEKTSEQALHMLSDKNRANREKAAKALGKTFAANIRLFSLITNTLAKDKDIEDKWRGYPVPQTPRHLSNQVEQEVVEALVAAVRDAYPRLSHRYYALKAKWMGLDHLEYWDRNAPLPDDSDKVYTWDDAVSVVLGAYGEFSPQLKDLGQKFFDNSWIDAPTKPGKSGGAFAHPTVPSAHPYLMLNFQGKARDVMTLAHELGHGVHQLLSASQGTLMSDTPLTLAETASVFGEQLTFRSLLKAEKDPARRKILLAGKVEDMINTVVRQIAFYQFECKVHDERKKGEISPERLGEIWMSIQGESLGPAIRFEDEYKHYWCYIPHFIHSPFYVYAYAFGDCLVNSLYAAYMEQPEGFEDKYFDMLKAGGTLRHKELLAPFNLDATDPAFWAKGLSMLSGFIDELEALEA